MNSPNETIINALNLHNQNILQIIADNTGKSNIWDENDRHSGSFSNLDSKLRDLYYDIFDNVKSVANGGSAEDLDTRWKENPQIQDLIVACIETYIVSTKANIYVKGENDYSTGVLKILEEKLAGLKQ